MKTRGSQAPTGLPRGGCRPPARPSLASNGSLRTPPTLRASPAVRSSWPLRCPRVEGRWLFPGRKGTRRGVRAPATWRRRNPSPAPRVRGPAPLVGQHVVHVHAIEDVFAQLLPRHLGRGARPARGCSARRQPVGTGAAGRDPGVGNSFRPPTGSSVLFSGGVHWLGGTEGPRPQPHLHSAAAVRQPHGNILPAGLGDGPLVVLCVGWRQPS